MRSRFTFALFAAAAITVPSHAAELVIGEGAGEFVVIAGNEQHARALACLAQEFLDDVIVRLRPEPALLEPPAVDDIADQIPGLGLVVAEEVQQQFGLGAARPQMHV